MVRKIPLIDLTSQLPKVPGRDSSGLLRQNAWGNTGERLWQAYGGLADSSRWNAIDIDQGEAIAMVYVNGSDSIIPTIGG
jgi:hypothetical protein